MDGLEPVNEEYALRKLRQVIDVVNHALEMFQDAMSELACGKRGLTETEVSKAIARLRHAYQMLVHERQKYEDTLYGKSGAFGSEPIDFEAARADIGRLLDRLRGSGDTGSVPGQPDA